MEFQLKVFLMKKKELVFGVLCGNLCLQQHNLGKGFSLKEHLRDKAGSSLGGLFYPAVTEPLLAMVVFYCLAFLVLSGGKGEGCGTQPKVALVCFNLLV